jgi:glycosyltransferase 2 family protein
MAKAKAETPILTLPGRTRGRVILLLLFLLLLYIVLPRLENFSASITALRDARPELITAALLLMMITFGFAAGVYQALALRLRGVQYRHTLLVQVAGAFTNRLLPAGIGGLTLNVQYLRKHGHTLSQAMAIAGLNNTLGFVGHLLLLGVVLLVSPSVLTSQLDLPSLSNAWLVPAGIVVLLVACLLTFRKLRYYVRKLWREVTVYLASYRKQPEKLIFALLCSLALTTCYVLVFYLCAQSVGVHLPLWNVFAVFTIGVLAGTVTPTPGGLVGAEAGLVAGLVAYGVDASLALAAVLLYRFLTYWLPLLPGFIVFAAIRRRYL